MISGQHGLKAIQKRLKVNAEYDEKINEEGNYEIEHHTEHNESNIDMEINFFPLKQNLDEMKSNVNKKNIKVKKNQG